MYSQRGVADAGSVVLAHPLTDPYALPISPLVLGYAAAAVVLFAAIALPQARRPADNGRSGSPVDDRASWAAPLGTSSLVTRSVGVFALVLAVVAGRIGVEDELENLAPALVIGVGWPLLVLLSVGIGPVWRWLDPWDSLARLLSFGAPPEPDPNDSETRSVWPAVIIVLPWLWYVSVYPDPLEPRSVGLALALYTVVTLAGCLAVGRTRWLSTAEPFGILLSWLSLLPARQLRRWQPPRGTGALLGVLAGGVLFGAARRSELWGALNTVRGAHLVALLGLLLACAAAAALMVSLSVATVRHGDRADVARAALPAVAGIVLAVSLDLNRFTTSLQLLPGLLGDPLGRGWDWFGPAGAGLQPTPFGVAGLIALQLAVLLTGALVGAVAVARSAPRAARLPAALSLAVLTDAAVLALATH